MNWIKHFLGLHQWLSVKEHPGNYVCRDCPRMSYDGPFGEGLEDYRVSEKDWYEYLSKARA
jgi:hypothetical protein